MGASSLTDASDRPRARSVLLANDITKSHAVFPGLFVFFLFFFFFFFFSRSSAIGWRPEGPADFARTLHPLRNMWLRDRPATKRGRSVDPWLGPRVSVKTVSRLGEGG